VYFIHDHQAGSKQPNKKEYDNQWMAGWQKSLLPQFFGSPQFYWQRFFSVHQTGVCGQRRK
jgi:hypothetical protein